MSFRWAPSSPLVPPAAHESGDSFTHRSPEGLRDLIEIRAWRHAGGLPGSPRMWQQFRRPQPPRDGEGQR
eukprot:3206952-Pyramimonas_sp.AAC.1